MRQPDSIAELMNLASNLPRGTHGRGSNLRSGSCFIMGAFLALLGMPGDGSGQTRTRSPQGHTARIDVERIDSLLAVAAPAKALAELELHLSTSPDEVEALWRAARAEALIGLLEENSRAARAYYRLGMAYAARALEIDPNHRDALAWSMVNKGRLALWTGARETADLAQDVWDITHQLLAEDPDDAMAHHALGVVHYEVRRMGWAKRLLARALVGGEPLSRAKWELATFHLRQSVVLEPTDKLYRLYYVRALAKQGWESESIVEAEMGLAQEITDPLNRRFHKLLRKHIRTIGEAH